MAFDDPDGNGIALQTTAASSKVSRQFPRLQRRRSRMPIGDFTVRDNPLSPGSDVNAVDGDSDDQADVRGRYPQVLSRIRLVVYNRPLWP